MSGWSNGWISTAPVSASNSRAARRQSSIDVPTKRISAPYARVAFSFGIGAPCGMNTVALIPSSCAASATPWAWLPALAATTPRAALGLGQPGHPHVRTTQLERPGPLQVLALQEHVAADEFTQPARVLQRRRRDHVMQQVRRPRDVLGIDHALTLRRKSRCTGHIRCSSWRSQPSWCAPSDEAVLMLPSGLPQVEFTEKLWFPDVEPVLPALRARYRGRRAHLPRRRADRPT